jgi:hypothetical protein
VAMIAMIMELASADRADHDVTFMIGADLGG